MHSNVCTYDRKLRFINYWQYVLIWYRRFYSVRTEDLFNQKRIGIYDFAKQRHK